MPLILIVITTNNIIDIIAVSNQCLYIYQNKKITSSSARDLITLMLVQIIIIIVVGIVLVFIIVVMQIRLEVVLIILITIVVIIMLLVIRFFMEPIDSCVLPPLLYKKPSRTPLFNSAGTRHDQAPGQKRAAAASAEDLGRRGID